MTAKVVAAVFAGGQSRRFDGQCKALMQIHGQSLLEIVATTLMKQNISDFAVCANQQADIVAQGYPTIEDHLPGHGGPLSALAGALRWGLTHGNNTLVLTSPCDTPFLPDDLLDRLLACNKAVQADVVIAASHGRWHPTVGLWRASQLAQLDLFLQQANKHSLKAWLAQQKLAVCDFTSSPKDPFLNINTAKDLALAKAITTKN